MHQIPATIRKANPSSIIPTPIYFTVSGLNNTTTHQKNTHAANTIEQRRVTLNTVLSVHAFFCFFIDSHSSFREALLSRTYFFQYKIGRKSIPAIHSSFKLSTAFGVFLHGDKLPPPPALLIPAQSNDTLLPRRDTASRALQTVFSFFRQGYLYLFLL